MTAISVKIPQHTSTMGGTATYGYTLSFNVASELTYGEEPLYADDLADFLKGIYEGWVTNYKFTNFVSPPNGYTSNGFSCFAFLVNVFDEYYLIYAEPSSATNNSSSVSNIHYYTSDEYGSSISKINIDDPNSSVANISIYDWFEQNNTSGYFNVTVTVGQWSGATDFSSLDKTFVVKVKASDSWVPEFDFSISESCNLVNGKYYAGYSGISFITEDTGSHPANSTINYGQSYIEFDGRIKIYNENDAPIQVLSVNPILNSGTLTAIATVINSRGQKTVKRIDVAVEKHQNPTIENYITERCDSSGELNEDGTNLLIKAKIACNTDVPDTKLKTISYFVREYGGSEWVSPEGSTFDIESENLISYEFSTVALYSFDTATQYEVKTVIEDNFGGLVEKTNVVTKSYLTMDFKSGGKGIAFGKAAEKDGFECDMPLYLPSATEADSIDRILVGIDPVRQVSFATLKNEIVKTNAVNITGGKANDTREFWRKQPNGTYYFYATNMLNGQPSQYGFLIHNCLGNEIHQEFCIQSNGAHYRRGCNGSVTDMPGFYRITDDSQNPVLLRYYNDSAHENHAGLVRHNLDDGAWMRTPKPGLLPWDNTGGGSCDLGSGTAWQFRGIYGKNIYKNGRSVEGYTILYNNDSTGAGAGVTLSETSANFSRLDIYTKNDGNYHCSSVNNPNGKTAILLGAWANFSAAAEAKMMMVKISGTSITKTGSSMCGVNASGTTRYSNNNSLSIVRVVGYV